MTDLHRQACNAETKSVLQPIAGGKKKSSGRARTERSDDVLIAGAAVPGLLRVKYLKSFSFVS